VAILFTGPLADRWGAKPFAMLGNVLTAAGLLLLTWVPGYLWLLIAMFIMGVGAGMLDMVLSPIVAATAPERRASAMNWLHSFYCTGAVVTVTFGAMAMKVGVSWRTASLILAVLPAMVLAGFAVIPAVFALGLEPTSGPGLIFATLPKVFAAIPAGGFFGCLFFVGLFGAGYLSDIGAFEVLVAGITDNTRMGRTRAVWAISAGVFLIAIPPTINNRIFVPWDLTFGSGMQTLGSLVAVLAVGWCMARSATLRELGERGERPAPLWLFYWIRFGIPAIIGGVGVWWLLSSVFGKVTAV
jgi:SNF family Na+-dependent transporter